MTKTALVCDCCGGVIGVPENIREARKAGTNAGGPGGAVYMDGKDMCGKCWGRGCEFGHDHLRRRA